MSEQFKDVFLSHTSKDKDNYVRPFAQELKKHGITYWLDEAEIRWGDKITKKINNGLRRSKYVIVFLSDNFLGRNWPEAELETALNKETSHGRTIVLPILIGNPETIIEHYPLLRDKLYLEWNSGLPSIVEHLKSLLAVADRDEDFDLKPAEASSGAPNNLVRSDKRNALSKEDKFHNYSPEELFAEFQRQKGKQCRTLDDLDWDSIKGFIERIPSITERIDFLEFIARLPDGGVENNIIVNPTRHRRNQEAFLGPLRQERTRLLSEHFNLDLIRRTAERIPSHLEAIAYLRKTLDSYIDYHPSIRQGSYSPEELNFCKTLESKIQLRRDLHAASPQTDQKSALAEENMGHANELYEGVKKLNSGKALDEDTARLLVELADDAIKEFGNTNQEKKVELRKWKAQAESSLPPTTIEELRKRAEGQLLKKSYPKTVALRNFLFVVIALAVVFLGLLALWRTLPKSITINPPASSSLTIEELPPDVVAKLSGVEFKAVDRSFEFTVLNETEWTVREIYIEFKALNKDNQSIGYKNDFRMGLSPDSSGEPYKVSKFVGELGVNWGDTPPTFIVHIVRAKGMKPEAEGEKAEKIANYNQDNRSLSSPTPSKQSHITSPTPIPTAQPTAPKFTNNTNRTEGSITERKGVNNRVSGIVIDADTKMPIAGARVYVDGNSGESVITKADGMFNLATHTASGQMFWIRAEKEGYAPKEVLHQTGSQTATIRLVGSNK